jgi:peptidoglycan-associated lipoprotein
MNTKARVLLIGLAFIAVLSSACKPQVSLKADRSRVRQGDDVTLTWTSKNAQLVTINGEPVSNAGSKAVRPQQTTSYEALAKRGDREARAFARVEVDVPTPAPTLSLSADRDIIERGEATTLRWATTDAESVEIGGLGRFSATGSQRVSPVSSTTYTAVASGPGGTDAKSVRITVNEPPPVESEPPPPQTPPPQTRNVGEELGSVARVIYFPFDSAELSQEAQAQLTELARWLGMAENRTVRFRIEGHCDERGTEEYNIGLGDRRANAARDFLLSLGIAPDRIETRSYGEARPAIEGQDESAWSRNRRDEFVYLSGGL